MATINIPKEDLDKLKMLKTRNGYKSIGELLRDYIRKQEGEQNSNEQNTTPPANNP